MKKIRAGERMTFKLKAMDDFGIWTLTCKEGSMKCIITLTGDELDQLSNLLRKKGGF